MSSGPEVAERTVGRRDTYPPGVPCWIDTTQPDPEGAVGFYGGLFGWEFQDRTPPDDPGAYFVARLHGGEVAAVASQPDGVAPTQAVWNTYISVDSADDTAKTVKDAGGQVVVGPIDSWDAGRMAICRDPSGAEFRVWEPRQQRGAQVVNVPGTWNFSVLDTPSPERAKAFYGEAFGWEAAALDLGNGNRATLLRLPGYGDFLEATSDPDIRSRQAAVDAPPGFEDVVAWLEPRRAARSGDDVPSHWALTFAVDDPDGIAERAAILGGGVVVPPFDAGPTRVAVLSDPKGAVFSVSRFDPER